MSNTLLSELQCARILVAVLGTDFGFDIHKYVGDARRQLGGGMIVVARSDSDAFGVSLTQDELALHIDDVKKVIAQQLQPHVFNIWAAA